MLGHDNRQRFREVEQVDNNYEKQCARDFWRWKIAKWFVIFALLFAIGMCIGLAVSAGRS